MIFAKAASLLCNISDSIKNSEKYIGAIVRAKIEMIPGLPSKVLLDRMTANENNPVKEKEALE